MSILVVCFIFSSSLEQEVLVWVTKLQEQLGGEVSNDQLKEFIWKTLQGGQVGSCKIFTTRLVTIYNHFTDRVLVSNH